jgi:hypothetical protein
MLYVEWRACERLGLVPSGIRRRFEENVPWAKLLIMAFEQVRETEDV